MDVFEVVKNRRSIREFKQEPIPGWKIETILDAARYAPSPENAQVWRFIVVKDNETKKLMADLAQERARAAFGGIPYEIEQERLWYLPPDVRPDVLERTCDGSLFRYPEQADIALVCCTSEAHQDSPLPTIPYESNICALAMAIQNMWLVTTALGLGAGFNAALCIGDARTSEILCEHLNIPRTWNPMTVFSIGVPKRPRLIGPSRFPLESICFSEQWGVPYRRLAFRKR